MPNSQPNQLTPIENLGLVTVTGGAQPAAASSSQAELRTMAQKYCPVTFAKNKNAPTLTRAMGERCLDEAGYGSFKSSLDKYFPRTPR